MEGQSTTTSTPDAGTASGGSASGGSPSAGSYSAIASAPASGTGEQASTETEAHAGGESGETAAQREARKFKYRKLTERGEYEDEEWDEEQVRKYLSDDYEEEYLVDGQRVKMPRHQARRNLMLTQTAYKRLEEAKKLREELEARAKAAVESPLDFIDEADGYAFAETIDGLQVTKAEKLALQRADQIYRLIELRNSGDPHKVSEYMALERERTARLQSAQQKRAEQQRQQEERQRRAAEYAERIRPEMHGALKVAGLKATNTNERRVARHMARAQELGMQMSLIDAAHLAREEYVNELRAELGDLDGGQLEAILGPLAKKVREHQIKTVERRQDEQATKPREPSIDKIKRDAQKSATAAARGISPIAFGLGRVK